MYKRTIRTGISILLAAAMMCGTVQAAPAEETQGLESTAVVSEYEGAVAEEVMPETKIHRKKLRPLWTRQTWTVKMSGPMRGIPKISQRWTMMWFL